MNIRSSYIIEQTVMTNTGHTIRFHLQRRFVEINNNGPFYIDESLQKEHIVKLFGNEIVAFIENYLNWTDAVMGKRD